MSEPPRRPTHRPSKAGALAGRTAGPKTQPRLTSGDVGPIDPRVDVKVDIKRASVAPPPRKPSTTAPATGAEVWPQLDKDHKLSDASATVSVAGGLPSSIALERTDLKSRYRVLGTLGRGASGEVRRAQDRALNRAVAIKTLRDDLARRDGMVARFVREARIVAQLEHPAIVPVHDLGQLPDGRWYIVMKEIHGRTLRKLVKELHKARDGAVFLQLTDGWTFRRVIDAYRTVCSALGFAHDKGVIHRDVKPDNIMIGSYGEVLLVDWGLAKIIGTASGQGASLDSGSGSGSGSGNSLDSDQVLGADDSSDGRSGDRATQHKDQADTSGSWMIDRGTRTRHGVIVGTPAYMSPEQARGESDRVGVRSDIWSLGGVLYTILYGRAPYRGRSKDVLRKVAQFPPEAIEGVNVPRQLEEIWRKAMRMDPSDRYPDTAALIEDIDAWVEGSRARAKALKMVDDARDRVPELRAAQADAVATRDRARAAVRALRNIDGLATKEAAWAMEQEAERLQDCVESLYLAISTKARLALAESQGLPEARQLLADIYRERANDAERLGDRKGAREYRAMLAEHDDGRYADYLRSDTLVSLVTVPIGASVLIMQEEPHAHRLVARRYAQTGPTPLAGLRLPVGHYVVELSLTGHDTVRYPIELRRGEPWQQVPPGGAAIQPIVLPPDGLLEGGERLVTAGWFWFGGDAEAQGSFPRQRIWVDSFVIGMGPVTHDEYLAFLNDLVSHGREDISTQYVPRLIAPDGDSVELLYDWDPATDRWSVPNHAAGIDLQGGSPVVGVTWHDAQSYCLWLRMKAGLPWRLPSEAEREKATRGVDGRVFPWGSNSDPAFHCMEDSPIGRNGPPPVSVYPIDTSPYGVMGLAGGVREWCAEPFQPLGPSLRGARPIIPSPPKPADIVPNPKGPRRTVRGGAWDLPTRACRAASRSGVHPTARAADIGFRVCRSFNIVARTPGDHGFGGSKR